MMMNEIDRIIENDRVYYPGFGCRRFAFQFSTIVLFVCTRTRVRVCPLSVWTYRGRRKFKHGDLKRTGNRIQRGIKLHKRSTYCAPWYAYLWITALLNSEISILFRFLFCSIMKYTGKLRVCYAKRNEEIYAASRIQGIELNFQIR